MYQNCSECLDKIIPALIKAQSEIGGAVKDGKNPHFGSSFSTLESVINACKAPLNNNDLMFVQNINLDNDKPILETKVYHSSGQWIASHSPLIVTKNDAQGYGSAISYFRRYSLATLLGICQVDDDGNEASKPPSITVEQAKQIEQLIGTDKVLLEKVQAYYTTAGAKFLKELPANRFNELLKNCQDYKSKQEVKDEELSHDQP